MDVGAASAPGEESQMATKTASREIEIVVVNPRAAFGLNQVIGETVRIVGVEYMEGVEIARIGDSYRELCYTCDASGFRPEYAGIFGGTCFYCKGSGLHQLIGSGTVAELAKVLVRRAKARDRAAAKREAKWAAAKAAHAAWLIANPAIADIAARFGRITSCEHELAAFAIAEYRECYREECNERISEIRDTHDPILLELAGAATCRVITDAQVRLLGKLVIQHAARVAAREAKAVKVAERKWLGAEKEKISATGTLAKPHHSESDWGSSTLYKLTTTEGDVVSWWRSGYHEFEAGARVTLTGTVKKLTDSEKYGKETVLTRCKVAGA